MANNYHAGPANTHFTPCAEISDEQEPGTDMLVIKRVGGNPTARTFVDIEDSDGDGNTTETITTGASDLSAGIVYLRTNATTGQFIDNASDTNIPQLGESDWLYLARIYFIRD